MQMCLTTWQKTSTEDVFEQMWQTEGNYMEEMEPKVEKDRKSQECTINIDMKNHENSKYENYQILRRFKI